MSETQTKPTDSVAASSGLSFERPLVEMQEKIAELEKLGENTHLDLAGEIAALQKQLAKQTAAVYKKLTPWETVKVARHCDRPLTADYIQLMLEDFTELHGDRLYRDDQAIVTGLATLRGRRFMLVGHRKGKTVKDRLACNFGCAHPEGYRKALGKMKLAEKLGVPIVSFINTPGAYPGIGAEERGQASAIATNILEMFKLKVPILVLVIGEGGSGGALGIGVGDRIAMLQYSYYSVISPEGCAAIFWKSGEKAPEAAEALKLTARDLRKNGLVDDVIEELLGGAHRDNAATVERVGDWITKTIDELNERPIDELLAARYDKFRLMGQPPGV